MARAAAPGAWPLRLLCIAFVLSGASSLAFEALWFHQTGLAFGNSVLASSLVLAAFMMGLAFGNLVAARYGDALRDGVRMYAALEVAVAVSGIALVQALPWLGSLLAPLDARLWDAPVLRNGLRSTVAFVLLFLPATAIGMTLPVLVRAARAHAVEFGSALGYLYGFNTIGGVLGVVAVELWWLDVYGVRGSAWFAGGLDVAAAGVALYGARSWRLGATEGVAKANETAGSAHADLRTGLPWLAAALLVGFAVLALEVVWLRFLVLFLNDTPLAFAMVLALVLSGIGAGGVIAGRWLARDAAAVRFAPAVAFGVGLLGLLGYLVYPWFLSGSLPARQGALTVVEIAAPLVLPATIGSGVLLPLLGVGLRQRTRGDARAVGWLVFGNTLGAGLGSLVAGYVLLPRLGMEVSFFLLFALCGVAGAVLAFSTGADARQRYGGVAVCLVGLALFPFGKVQSEYVRVATSRWMRPSDALLDVREGLTATLVHVVHRHAGVDLFDHVATNAYSMTTNGFLARRYMDTFVYLPVAIHPRIERALVVGFGVGNTARALTGTPEIEHIDVVDISTAMLEESRRLALPLEPHPLDDPRTEVHIEDGRYFLLASGQRYDLITGEPPPPIIAGVGNLYSREYFRLIRDRLNPGGIASYWLPLPNITAKTAKSIIAAFCEAFPDCTLWNGAELDLVLLGTREGGEPVDTARFGAQWERPDTRAALRFVGLEVPGQLAALFIGDSAYLRELTAATAPLADDWPRRLAGAASRGEGDALLARLQDPGECRRRFEASAWIRTHVPEPVRRASVQLFEVQRLISDLISPQSTVSREARTLHKILHGMPFELPVVLFLGSSPDYQRALARVPVAERNTPAWRVHELAGLLARRDLTAARALAARMPVSELPIADLAAYLEFAVRRAERRNSGP